MLCSLKIGEPPTRVLQEAKLIIWDEAPMTHKHLFEATDRLRDIMSQVSPELGNLPFAGKVIVFGGDFKQVLPVVPRGSRGQIVQASLKTSDLWQRIRKYKLSINMRECLCRQQGDAANAIAQQQFSDFLLRIGDGREPVVTGEDMIRLPASMCAQGDDPAVLLDKVYGTNVAMFNQPSFMVGRGILFHPQEC